MPDDRWAEVRRLQKENESLRAELKNSFKTLSERMKNHDWSHEFVFYHDFNDDDHLFLKEGYIVFAGNNEGGMQVRLGRATVSENGGIVIPFEQIEGTWIEPGEK